MIASKSPTRIGVVVHGPEVIDSGFAPKVLKYLERFGAVDAVLGGTMGRLAIIDAGLEGLIKISPKRRPSQSIKGLQPNSDIIVLLSQAKTRETGLAFGTNVAAAAGSIIPLIQIDCGGRLVAIYYGSEKWEEIAKIAAKDLGLEYIGHIGSQLPQERWIDKGMGNSGLDNIGIESGIGSGSITYDGDIIKRRLTGVQPGETISINGVVIAKATSDSVEVWAQKGKIIEIKGAEKKLHGLEKLSDVDLPTAIIRSGYIRRTAAKPRTLECKGDGAALIDHSAEDTFEMAEGACIAITVGDDTTAIAGDILSRMGIPIIGIVDGDPDGLSQRTVVAKGSMIIRLEHGYDDKVGRQIKEEIFHGKSRATIRASDLAEMAMNIAGKHIVQVERL